ncbi:hypothetical protein O3P69_009924 [Scylla paramamosain]|uniref:Uncharacterized protein n=1 Tax=Scylla paramamosain TaxID=85552 RepID=A0AAW0SML3_SCYPA
MRKLLGDKYPSFDKELFLQLFYQRLPPDTQRCLFTVKNKLSVDELATLADEFMATLPQDAIYAVTRFVPPPHTLPKHRGFVPNPTYGYYVIVLADSAVTRLRSHDYRGLSSQSTLLLGTAAGLSPANESTCSFPFNPWPAVAECV